MMNIRPFNPYDHNHAMIDFLKKRKMNHELFYDLPKIGRIAYHDFIPVAMGFVRWIEGSYAMLDSYITDPEVSPEIRNEALDEITKALLQDAKVWGVKKIFAFSLDPHTIKRAHSHGFGEIPFQFTCLNLKEDSKCHS